MTHFVSKSGFPDLPLTPGMILRLEARATATDAAVAGVSASLWAIYGWQSTDATMTDEPPPYSLDLAASEA